MQEKAIYINKKINPKGLKKDQYDVIIIGAGIGGLVCGCYLAKAGLKVLIIEKNNKVGGYVQSFERDGFVFDTGVHSLEDIEKEGILGGVIKDLNLFKYVNFYKKKITDTFIFSNNKVNFFNNIDETTDELKNIFKEDSNNINQFFKFLKNSSEITFFKFRNKPFLEIVNTFFKNQKLKFIFLTLMRNLGVPSSKISATTALIFLKKYLLDGGYYPKGGMQNFSNALFFTLKDLGGNIIFDAIAKKITRNKDKELYYIEMDKDTKFFSKKIVCAGDISYAIKYLLSSFKLPQKIFRQLDDMKTTLSVFITYIGVNKNLRKEVGNDSTIWILDNNTKNIDKEFEKVYLGKILLDNKVKMVGFGPINTNENKDNIYIIKTAKYDDIWLQKNNDIIAYSVIQEVENSLGLNLSSYIKIITTSTPYTLYKYTLNKNGAIHGWIPSPKQIHPYLIIKELGNENIYFVGHWVTGFGQGGIPWVIITVLNVLKKILRNK